MQGRLADGAAVAVPAALVALGVGIASALSPIGALAAGGALALVVAVFFNATALLLVLVAAFPWDDALAYPTETVSVVKLLGALVMVGYVVRVVARQERLLLPGTLGWLCLFTIWVLLATLLSPDPATSLQATLRYLLFAGFFFLFVQLVRTRVALRASVRALVASVSLAALIALTGFLSSESGLASGPIGDPNDFAYVLATVLPLAGYLIVADGRYRWLWLAAALLLVAALLATLSRGAIVGLLALGVWALATRRVPLGGVLATGMAVIAIVVLAFTFWGPLIDERVQAKGKVAAENVDSRQALWAAAMRMAGNDPLFGVGPGRFGEASPDYLVDEPIGLEDPVVHNSFLEVLAELGLPALVAFLLFLAGSWRLAGRALRESEAAGDVDGRRLALTVQAGLVVAVVSGCFLSAQVIVPFWLLTALAAAVAASRAMPEAAATAAPHRAAPSAAAAR